MIQNIQRWLNKQNNVAFSLYATTTAFCTYSSMYAFRKPFTVATFDTLEFWNIDYKVLLITAQVLGYTLSKFLGIKIISEMEGKKRSFYIIGLITLAGLALFLFAIIPPPYNILCLFLNGLPLGMIWGLVFSYLEGRKLTEVLGAGLSVSFIFSSGFTKSVGKYVMINWGVPELWMPFVTGLLFTIPLIASVTLLNSVPPPSSDDISARTVRKPMSAKERKQFFLTFAPGLTLLIIAYMLLTMYRDFRDNFAAEIWTNLGYENSPGIFTTTEVPVSLGVLVIIGSIILIKRNTIALMVNHLLVLFGILLVGFSTWLFQVNLLAPPVWMILTGFGLYMGYVPFNSVLFDRLIASFHTVGNAGFLIYLADSFGYLGSVGILFYKEFGQPNLSWVEFFMSLGYFLAGFGGILITCSMLYFYKRKQIASNIEPTPEPNDEFDFGYTQ